MKDTNILDERKKRHQLKNEVNYEDLERKCKINK